MNFDPNKFFNKYTLKARLLPSIISITPPIIVFNHFFLSEEFSKFVNDFLFGSKFISNLSISIIFLYFFSELGRFISKNVFEKIYFKDELNMPTTNYLMFVDNTYSHDFKKNIRKKILSDFSIKLFNENDENLNELDARKIIVETMYLIRKKLMKNKFLLQHNIEYGMMRNIIGGSVIGTILSIVNIVFFSNFVIVDMAVHINIVTLFIYVFLILFSKVIINFYGKNYAKILIREYMGSKK